MNCSADLIIWAILAFAFNLLDEASTRIGMKTPEDIKNKEGNPIAREMMLNHPRFASVSKIGGLGVLVLFLFALKETLALATLAIAFGIVVVNNFYLIIIKKITQKEHTSPFIILARKLKIPKSFEYLFACFCIFSITIPLVYLITS